MHANMENNIRLLSNPSTRFQLIEHLILLHMDLFGPIDVSSLRGSRYAFVVVDYYTRYTWVMFLIHKNETFDEFAKLCR